MNYIKRRTWTGTPNITVHEFNNKPPEVREGKRSKDEQIQDFRKIQESPEFSDRAKQIAQKGIDNLRKL